MLGEGFLIRNGKICKNKDFLRDNSQNVKHIISSTSSGNHLQRNILIRENMYDSNQGKGHTFQQGYGTTFFI